MSESRFAADRDVAQNARGLVAREREEGVDPRLELLQLGEAVLARHPRDPLQERAALGDHHHGPAHAGPARARHAHLEGHPGPQRLVQRRQLVRPLDLDRRYRFRAVPLHDEGHVVLAGPEAVHAVGPVLAGRGARAAAAGGQGRALVLPERGGHDDHRPLQRLPPVLVGDAPRDRSLGDHDVVGDVGLVGDRRLDGGAAAHPLVADVHVVLSRFLERDLVVAGLVGRRHLGPHPRPRARPRPG